jgi:hypothetical protein
LVNNTLRHIGQRALPFGWPAPSAGLRPGASKCGELTWAASPMPALWADRRSLPIPRPFSSPLTESPLTHTHTHTHTHTYTHTNGRFRVRDTAYPPRYPAYGPKLAPNSLSSDWLEGGAGGGGGGGGAPSLPHLTHTVILTSPPALPPSGGRAMLCESPQHSV